MFMWPNMPSGYSCVDVACVLGWWVLNCGGCRTMWRFVLWRWLRCTFV